MISTSHGLVGALSLYRHMLYGKHDTGGYRCYVEELVDEVVDEKWLV